MVVDSGVVGVPVLFHFGEVIGGPREKSQEGLVQGAPERCDAVLHGNGTLLEHSTFDKAIAFQPAQCLCERLLRDPVEFPLELVEASRLLAQRRQQQLAPFVEELIQQLALRPDDRARNGLISEGTRFR